MVWNVQGFVNDEQGLIVLVAELVLKKKLLLVLISSESDTVLVVQIKDRI